MTDRVLRWLSATSLAVLMLAAALDLSFLPSFAVHLPVGAIGAFGGLTYVLGLLVLPTTAVALCEVTGIATLVISLQRKQWGWFAGVLLCLLLHFYAGLTLSFPQGFRFLYQLAGSSSAYALSIVVLLYNLVARAPLVLLALVYAWTHRRRHPASASAAG